ncbi:protein of unknown function [Citrobacter amalonaticus]|uniref:Uncharacterized protein n=1 Tax=Citrobacter amalonaticus TaxID=35703 RepID=A0AAX2BIK7_CITAM|nr:protein of unknown function [Citrobacter amalonaticus]SAZ94929.1 protein of unknown function [Citrobacter amalonaticus]
MMVISVWDESWIADFCQLSQIGYLKLNLATFKKFRTRHRPVSRNMRRYVFFAAEFP